MLLMMVETSLGLLGLPHSQKLNMVNNMLAQASAFRLPRSLPRARPFARVALLEGSKGKRLGKTFEAERGSTEDGEDFQLSREAE